jgi:hypothetical protein
MVSSVSVRGPRSIAAIVFGPRGALSKLGHSRHILDVFELLAHLHHRVSDQSRIQTHRSSEGVLCTRTRIKAHDEVMAIVVCRLEFLGGFGKQESAPVGVAAHDALLGENDGACGFGDSVTIVRICAPQCIQWRRWCSTLLLRRGGQAGPANVSHTVGTSASQYTPLLSSHTACCLSVVVELPTLLHSPAAKTFSFRARYATGTHADMSWHPSYLQSFEATPNLSIPHTQHKPNGCSIFCRSRRAPIDICCCEEACAMRVPKVAAAGAEAAAILGICRMYVEDVGRKSRMLSVWMANIWQ